MGLGKARGPVESALLDFMRSHGPAEDQPLIVAYSGGPDSTALLAAAAALHPKNLLAVHVDHGLRSPEERQQEAALVRATCSRLGLRLTVAGLCPGSVAARARRCGCGIEAAARSYRYAAFRALLSRESAEHLFLAHTRDDQVETILMRLFGASSSSGLRGMATARSPWYRPFLGLTKAELMAYLEDRGLAWSIDSTNASSDFLRNRLRNRLIPLLDADFPGWRKGLARTVDRLGLEADALHEAARAIAFGPEIAGRLTTSSGPFLAAPEAVRRASLLEAFGRLAGPGRANPGRISSEMAGAALRALDSRSDGRYIGGGLRIGIVGDLLLLERGLDFPRRGGYFVVIDRPCRIRAGRLVVETAWKTGGARGIRASAFRFPLVVRSRRPGDAIALPGGRKRLDDLFSEWELGADERGLVPVVEDRDGIVAVLGAAFGAADRYRRGPDDEDGESPRLSVTVKGA